MSNPSDLNIVTQPDTDKNYFNFKAAGLKIDTNYAIKFQWVYEDGTVSEWSAGKFINTSTEVVPGAPSVVVPSTAIGNIPVTLSAFPANTKRVDIYIIGGVYGAGKVADSFLSAGTKNISVVAGVYQVSLIAVTPSGINGNPTNTFTITISNLVTEDTVAPNSISAGVVTGGVHPQDSSGQLGYLNVAVTNSTIPADFAGYIVKIVSSTNTWTQTFNSTTALSNLYITGGLFVGQAYTLSVATTDGKNVSSYINCTPAPFTITDTRSNTSTVTGSLAFSATDSILNVSWAASTDTYVDSYRVQITSNADTTFATPLQTVESKGTTVSFGGLTSSTAYRVRVTTRYSGSNALSTNHTTGTVTLNASGAISDGNVPTTNPGTGAEPAILVKSLFKAFALNWSDIVNADQVTYEVYVKTVNSTNIVDPLNLVMEINGTFAVINSLKDGTAIAYPAETSPTTATDYYFAIRAKDADGISSAAVTPVGPFTASRTGQFDIASNAIYANHITAGEITADKMTTDLLFVNKTISVGESGSLNRIRLASSIAIPVLMTDSALPSPSTYPVKSRIFIGSGNYYSVGTSFYADDTGRFSIADKLRFDGTNLLINGSGTFTGTVTAGSGSNSVKLGNDVNGTNDGIYIGATGDYIYTDGTVRLGNGGITYASGVLTVTGNITANSIAANTSLSGLSITGTSGTIGGITLNSSGLSATNFSISSTGLITANGGTIGGWTINSTQLRSSAADGANRSYISFNPATPKIALITGATFTSGVPSGGTEAITIDPVSGIVGPSITVAGNTGPGFSFSPNGTATLRGSVYATTGVIGGWTLGSSSFTGGGTSLNSSGTISLTGGTVSGNGESFTAGNLTLNSGAITSNSTLFLTANDLYYDSNFAPVSYSYPTWVQGTNLSPINYFVGSRCTYNGERYVAVQYHQSTGSTPNVPSTAKSGGYLWAEEANSLLYVDNSANVHIGERGTRFTSLGSPRNALSFRINTFDRGDGYYGRGYVLSALDTSEFKYSTSASGITAPTVVVGFYGQLYNGRAFYYGSAGTSSAINTEVGGSIGDVYFSTV